LHTENGNLCEVLTTFTTGLTALNGLTSQVQYFAVGTSGTDFNISSATDTHTFNLPTASATNRGALSSADWSAFNGKFNLPSLTSGSVLFSNGTTIAQDNANFFWDDTNNRLGIGTTSPTSRLTVLNTSSTTAALFGGGVASPAWVAMGTVNSGAAPFIQGISNSLGTTVDLTLQPSGGDVGIGTTNPIGKLDVVGTVAGGTLLGGRFSNITANETGVKTRIELPVFNGSSGGVIEEIGNSIDGYRLNIYQSQSSGVLTFGTAGDNERMRINSTGNVGIGISTPSIKFQVETSVNGSDGIWARNTNTGTSAFGSINCVSGVGAINLRAHSAAHSIWANTSMINSASAFTGGMVLFQDGANPISLWTNGSERMRVTSAGNVGIGTTAPAARLDVRAQGALSTDIAFRVRNSADTANLMSVQGNGLVSVFGDFSLPTGNAIRFGAGLGITKTSATMSIYGGTNPGAGGTLDLNYWNGSVFAVGLRLNNNANVLIGTTTDIPSAVLNVNSTTQGFLPPRMTNAQRIAIATPAVGLCVYCTDVVEGLYINKSTGWTYIG
jgi:hypothetical protein